MKTVVLTEAAFKQLLALPPQIQDRIDSALNSYAISGAGDVAPLKGGGLYRMRIGRYRVIFDEDLVTILGVYIGKRETTTYRKDRLR